jgi:uncharacterized protein (DUF3084 family)
MMDILSFAHQVIDLHDRIAYLEAENARLQKYEQDYHNLLDSSMQHNQIMMMNMLQVCSTPGVVDAMMANRAPDSDS